VEALVVAEEERLVARMVTTAPAVRPVSAVYMFVCTLTSATASTDGRTPRVPI